jgi:hypothetical protein
VKVVVDESRLEPSVAQFVPFEVLGGSHAADLRSDDRRFFQYEYRLRLIAENIFGKDVALPETKLTYRIQSRVAQKTSVEGRDQTYLLPPLSMKMLSLVPADASDIRDAGSETFADVDNRAFRANLLTVIGGVLFALAALVGVLSLVRLYISTRKPATTADRLVGDTAILRGVGRELADVQRAREGSGWTSDLAARALTALRIIGTYAIGKDAARAVASRQSPVASNQSPATSNDGGKLFVNVGWPKTKQIAVSGSATARTVANTIARSTEAQYGRDGKLDDSALDQSLAAAQQVLRRLKLEHTWVMTRLGRRRKRIQAESRVWSR